jgi:hypothetical protein
MAREYVDSSDATNLVLWITGYARAFGRRRGPSAVARRLERLYRRHGARLRRTAVEGRGA